MKITPCLFEAYLKCSTKCWLRSVGEASAGNTYAEWVKSETESYRSDGIKRLMEGMPPDDFVVSPPAAEEVKAARWRLAVDLTAQTDNLESRLHAVERVPSEGRGRPAQFIPIRFIYRNKLTKDDKLLLAFDALVLSEMLGREVSLGKIIHGDDHATQKVKVGSLIGEVRKRIEKITALLSANAPPDLVLNRHCGECEFQARCRKIAVEKDDLSLLANMSEKERKEYNSKGIFTVTQLSYTFRPRRRPKRLRDRREKYHHSLKALAIREKKIHIVGSPELKIEGTPVYLDVEGLPDSDFYYLIGLRIGNGASAVQHSLWADTVEDEGKIWREFLGLLSSVERPILITYGSYEACFLKQMSTRHGNCGFDEALLEKVITELVNLLSFIYAQIYFPTHSNGLKEVAGHVGFRWSNPEACGLQAVLWRSFWKDMGGDAVQRKLTIYNTEDCQALALVTNAISQYAITKACQGANRAQEMAVVFTDAIEVRHPIRWDRFTSPITEFEAINNAAHWDYQRDRIYVKTRRRVNRSGPRRTVGKSISYRINKQAVCPAPFQCPRCAHKPINKMAVRSRILLDLLFGRFALKRWVVRYVFRDCWCPRCKLSFGLPDECWSKSKHGWNLVAYLVYEFIELNIPQTVVARNLAKLFGIGLNNCTLKNLKALAAEFYAETRQAILKSILSGTLVHADETHASIGGKTAYVWVLTNVQEVMYFYSETREGEIVQGLLRDFKGILVSDFYAPYDSIACPQQKCLIHLIRDLNNEVLNHPYDDELKRIVKGFAEIARPMIETVDRYGLKKHFLRKHLKDVNRFYRDVVEVGYRTEAAIKCKERFQKNRDKLFTFLQHSGVPWNNNNAEHAMKAFAALRDVLGGASTPKSLSENLTLLSICQTCKYQGLDFLDFLRSREKDIHAFAESRRRRRSQSSQPSGLQAGGILDSAVNHDTHNGK